LKEKPMMMERSRFPEMVEQGTECGGWKGLVMYMRETTRNKKERKKKKVKRSTRVSLVCRGVLFVVCQEACVETHIKK